MIRKPIARSSTGRALCQECSDVIEDDEQRTRTPAGMVHAECVTEQEQAA